MPRWTKKAALERMTNNQELQQILERSPLAQLLVTSATAFRRYQGYHRISCYYAYKDWMRAAIGQENEAFWIAVKVIDDLLPPDDTDVQKENGSSISTYNPPLPGLPPRPKREREMKLYDFHELKEIRDEEQQRYTIMRAMLEEKHQQNTKDDQR